MRHCLARVSRAAACIIDTRLPAGDPLVALFQNGINTELAVQKAFPRLKLASCVLYLAVTQPSPGVINFGEGSIQNLVMGLYSGHHYRGRESEGRDAEQAVQRLFSLAQKAVKADVRVISPGCVTESNTQFQAVRFHKTSWNVAFGGLGCLSGYDTLSLLEDAGTYALLEKMLGEVYGLAERALGVSFPPGIPFSLSLIPRGPLLDPSIP